ncbi:ABC transporter type 1, transmembrane domain [Phytophthora cactorum]|nr:ABC transporter type 1, transmembrane domain [Phytophthora cactorum]
MRLKRIKMPPAPKSPRQAPYTALSTPRGAPKASKPSNSSSDTSPSFLSFYPFASPSDKLQLALGALFAGLNGAIFPCMALVFGAAINAFAQADEGVDLAAVNRAALYYFLIAVALLPLIALPTFSSATQPRNK